MTKVSTTNHNNCFVMTKDSTTIIITVFVMTKDSTTNHNNCFAMTTDSTTIIITVL